MFTRLAIVLVVLTAIMLAPFGLPGLFPHMDMVLHALVCFSATHWLSQRLSIRKSVLVVVIFGGLLEVAQGALPVRAFEVSDAVANVGGAVLYWVITCIWKRVPFAKRKCSESP